MMEDNLIDFKILSICVITGCNMYITNVFGVFTPLLYLVCGLMITDLITRSYSAAVRDYEKVDIKKVIQGIFKKLGMIMLIVLSLVLDYGALQLADTLGINISSKVVFTALTLAWLFVRELISNLENLNHAGVDLPPFILKALNIAKDKVDTIADNMVGSDIEKDKE